MKIEWYNDKITGDIHKVVEDKITKMGAEILATAKANCPVLTGKLRDSIELGIEVKDTTIVANIGTEIDYGVYVEFGTRFMPAQSFLRTALEANKDKI